MFGQSTTKRSKTKQQKQPWLVSRNNAGSYWITWRWSQQSISNISTWFPEGFQTGRTPISGTERGNLQFVCWPKASSQDISRWFLITVLWQKGTISEVQAKDSLAEYVLQAWALIGRLFDVPVGRFRDVLCVMSSPYLSRRRLYVQLSLLYLSDSLKACPWLPGNFFPLKLISSTSSNLTTLLKKSSLRYI